MTKISYAGYRFPPVIIQQAVWLYARFTLSFRDVEDLNEHPHHFQRLPSGRRGGEFVPSVERPPQAAMPLPRHR